MITKFKLFENHRELDPYGEEDWDDDDTTFLQWLKNNYPDENTWDTIIGIDCYNNHLTDLEGIENLTNLKELYFSYNDLTSLEGIENLTNLKSLWCANNIFSEENKKYLRTYCDKNKINLKIN